MQKAYSSRRRYASLLCVTAFAAACTLSVRSNAAVYSDGLTTASSAGYNVNVAQSTDYTTANENDGTSKATFGFDYSTVGVPQDPNYTAGGTHALEIQAAYSSTSYGGISISPTGFSLPNDGTNFTPFTIQYDEWTNFVSSGVNSTTLAEVGVGADGTHTQFIFNNHGTVMFANTIDGGTGTSDYRAYANNTYQGFSNGTNYNYYGAYSVANTASTAILNNTYSGGSPAVAFYEKALTGNGSINAPATETGNTPSSTTGTTSYAWHVVDVSFTGTDYIWSIDGTVLADVPSSGVMADSPAGPFGNGDFNGANFFIGGSDTGSTGNGGNAAADKYNFILVDNLTVVPEPASLSILGLGALGLLRRRRQA